jgi:hypothetical protein
MMQIKVLFIFIAFKDFRFLKNLIMSLALSGINMSFALKKEKIEKEN